MVFVGLLSGRRSVLMLIRSASEGQLRPRAGAAGYERMQCAVSCPPRLGCLGHLRRHVS